MPNNLVHLRLVYQVLMWKLQVL